MLISVITPTYNRARFLPETIASVANQTYPYVEHIVVDDGSTDETPELLSRYPNLTVIRQPNKGESYAVNAGMRAAKGDIIVVINSDDPMRPGALHAAANTLLQHPDAVLAYGDWDEIDIDGKTTREMRLPRDHCFESLLRTFNIAITPAAFFRATALKQAGYRHLDRKFTGDIDLAMRVSAIGAIVHIPAVCATHRVHGEATMSTSMGLRMGSEVAQLARDCLKMPHGLTLSAKERRKIMAHAYSVSTFFCGSNHIARCYYLLRSTLLDPTDIVDPKNIIRTLKLTFRIAVVRFFRWIYNNPELSVRRTVKSWLPWS